MPMARVLCVEDDPDIADLVRYNMERAGHKCAIASDGRAALDSVHANTPDIVLLDIMMPKLDGIQVCRQLRSEEEFRELPILMLTAKGEEADVVGGLEAGADDYMVKPFSPRELVARVATLLRRAKTANSSDEGVISFPGLRINVESHEVEVDGEDVKLTLSEFRLLYHLAKAPDRVFTRSQLLDRLAGREAFIIDRNVDVHVRNVRKKIGRWAPAVTTVRGIGYKFVARNLTEGEE